MNIENVVVFMGFLCVILACAACGIIIFTAGKTMAFMYHFRQSEGSGNNTASRLKNPDKPEAFVSDKDISNNSDKKDSEKRISWGWLGRSRKKDIHSEGEKQNIDTFDIDDTHYDRERDGESNLDEVTTVVCGDASGIEDSICEQDLDEDDYTFAEYDDDEDDSHVVA